MTISDEIKGLLAVTGKKRADLARYMGLKYAQSLNNKFNRNSWSAEDLIHIALFLGGELIIRVGDREVKLTENHIAKPHEKKKVDQPAEAKSNRIPLKNVNIDKLLDE